VSGGELQRFELPSLSDRSYSCSDDSANPSTQMGKTNQNRRLYIEILRRMTPEQRLRKALELTRDVREIARAGIRSRNPDLTSAEVDRLAVEQLLRWHSKAS